MSKQKTFGRYEVQRILGRGGMGTVYLAVDPVIDRTVAIKEISVDHVDDVSERTELEARFKLEYRSAGTLSHPNIVTIYDVVEDDGSYFIAMEYVEGVSLAQRLKQEPNLPFSEISSLASQIASGLDYAHGRDIVHRDIKPGNVLLTPEGRPKITDFGLAKWRTSELTMTGTVLGTPAFMSPEQVTGQTVDGTSDQFSFAIILYLMLTGAQPFHAEHPSAILYKIVHEQPPLPRELNKMLPPAVDRTLLRGLAKRPEDRYPSCSELATDLQAALADDPTTPLPRQTVTVATVNEPTRPLDAATPSPTDSVAPDDIPLNAATPTPMPTSRTRQRQSGGGAGRWLIGAFFIAAIGAAAYWASSLRRQTLPEPAEETVVEAPMPAPAEATFEHILQVTAGPAGASIRVNDEETGLTVPAELPVAGKVGEILTLEVVADDRVLATRELEIGAAAPAPWLDEPLPAAVNLRITSQPEGALIRLGGRDTGFRTPAEVELNPGHFYAPERHALSLTLDGYEPAGWTFTLQELNERQRTRGLHFPLTSSAPPGWITVSAPYPVTLQIGGRKHGPFARGEVEVVPGRHEVVLLAEDVFLRQTNTIEVGSDERKSLRAPKAVAVRITANPANCEVSVNGVDVGVTPIINRRMVVGSHEFVFYWPAEDARKTVRKTVSREGQRISETHN